MTVSERGATKVVQYELPKAPQAKIDAEFDRLLNKDRLGRDTSRNADVQRALDIERKVRSDAFKEWANAERARRNAAAVEKFGRRLVRDLGTLPVSRALPLGRVARVIDLGLTIYHNIAPGDERENPGMPVTVPGTGLPPGTPFDPRDYGWYWSQGGCTGSPTNYACKGNGATASGWVGEYSGSYDLFPDSNPLGNASADWSNFATQKYYEYVQNNGLFSMGTVYAATVDAVDPYAGGAPSTSFAPQVQFDGNPLNPNIRRYVFQEEQLSQEEWEKQMELEFALDDAPYQLRAPEKFAISVTVAPATKTKFERVPLTPRKPDGDGQKVAKFLSFSRKLMIGVFHALDVISEGSEIVDAAFEALPSRIRKPIERAHKRDSQFRRMADNAGQYGVDGADWKTEALWKHWHSVDAELFVENVIKNAIEDMILGAKERARPKNSINAFQNSDLAIAKALNDLLDEHVRFDQGATHLEQWRHTHWEP